MTFRIPPQVPISAPPSRPAVANLDELKEEPVQGHPTSVLYKLLIGPRTGRRDRINAAYVVADLFLMDFAQAERTFLTIMKSRRKSILCSTETGTWLPAAA